ncbi:hypothetical protein GRF29_161g137927 [Pseudopithomyces chartarum]|uniref:Amidase domain-containing protein n=1 Tax=Pseudopithomyces chartarum TaxID=1892770 RepID=A0AAN6LPX9_9PLEO|nr:hypothetical protein GRF29_161g137927 [Pseudopithomyces chartarum]
MIETPSADSLGKAANLSGWIPPKPTDSIPLFDPLKISAITLQNRLLDGTLTSVQILKEYYRQILSYNGYLRAIHQLAPGAIERAEYLDDLRRRGVVLGPLHGIPVLLKDNIGTDQSMGMDTTAGSVALVGSVTINNAPIVDQELMWFKGHKVSVGWSSLCGQGQNPYIKGGVDPSDGLSGHSSPGGSSSGSGIAVAAGFAPLSIGTETEGSINCPATRNSLYAVKPTLGAVSNRSIVPISMHLDTAGPMGINAEDVANLLTVLVGSGRPDVPPGGYRAAMSGADGWKDLDIGVLDPEIWRYDHTLQTVRPNAIEQIVSIFGFLQRQRPSLTLVQKQATFDAYGRIEALARSYHYGVSLRPNKDFDWEGSNSVIQLMIADFARDFDKYLEDNPGQESIEEAVAFPQSSDRRDKLLRHISEVGKSFPETLDRYNINVIIGPADSWFTKYSAATGENNENFFP